MMLTSAMNIFFVDVLKMGSVLDFIFLSRLSLMPIIFLGKIVSEYDQEIPQSQTADDPVAPRGRAAQTPRDTRKTN